MEVKLVITPSEEMVALVDKVINAFTKYQTPAPGNVEQEIIVKFNDSIIDEKIEEIKAVQVQPESVKRRRTKAEIEAEKQSLTEKAEATEEAAEQVAEQPVEETTTKTVDDMLGFVPSVVKLRKMTVNRSEKIDDVPAKLMEFGYNSVTALAKDEEAAKRYYVYLIGVAPLTDADNE
jgi:hypothetical protein